MFNVDSPAVGTNTSTKSSVSSSYTNIDNLTLAYLNCKVYANPTEYRVKYVGQYEIASCRAISFDGKSMQGFG